MGRTIGIATVTAAAAIFFAVVMYQFWGVIQDTLLVLNQRFGVDYGEGIVWQQVLLMFGPRMYNPSPDLPFIVFHYPPLYHFVVRGLLTLGWDPLFTGRLVSVAGLAISALSIAALILAGTRDPRNFLKICLTVTVAALFMCLPAVRTWGVYMRVDMLAVALGLLGTVVFAFSRGTTAGTTIALVLCVASLFAKQTQLPAGIAIFLVALVCAPRAAIIAALVAGTIGLACVATLELATGGFLKNIITYNVNPFTVTDATSKIWRERESGPALIMMLLGLVVVAWRFKRQGGWTKLRARDRQTITETVVALHFILACFSAFEILKDGSSNNYFIDMFASGSVLIGFVLCNISRKPLFLAPAAAILTLTIANMSHHYFAAERLNRHSAESERLVAQIAAADRPVSSDDMILVLRAGKSLVFEPAIIRVLVAGGKWDPAPLLAMIRDHGFAFMLTFTSGSEAGPLVAQAIRQAYPRQEEFQRNITVNYAQ